MIDQKYQRQGTGKGLIFHAINKAKELGFKKLYLFIFDSSLSDYYKGFGWEILGQDVFQSHPITIIEAMLWR